MLGGPFWLRVIYKCYKKTYMEARPTTSMKKGWLCRTSYDEIVHTWWWPEMIQIELWSRSSYDDSDRSRSSDDPDPTMMIQIERWSRSRSRLSDDPDPVQWWWSRLSNDPDLVMMFYDDPDRVMIQIQFYDNPDWEMIQIHMTWRWRLLEDEDDPVDTEKDTSAENHVERIPS